MKKVTFELKDGRTGPTVDALGQLFLAIEARDGVVTPYAIVDESRSPDSPTHSLFEWDDVKAAEAHRRNVAGRYLGQLCVIRGEDRQRVMAATTVIRGTTLSGYLELRKIANDEQAMKVLAAQCYAILAGWRKRAQDIEAFKDLWSAFDAIEPPED